MTFRCLGIDPGTTSVAAAIVARDAAGWRFVDSPTLSSLDGLMSYLVDISRDELHCVCVEDLTWIGATRRHRQECGSVEILRSVGAAQLFAKQLRIPFVEVRPQSWRKRIVGSGKATKQQVRTALMRIVSGMPERMGLNRSDAVAVAVAGAMEPGAKRL